MIIVLKTSLIVDLCCSVVHPGMFKKEGIVRILLLTQQHVKKKREIMEILKLDSALCNLFTYIYIYISHSTEQ